MKTEAVTACEPVTGICIPEIRDAIFCNVPDIAASFKEIHRGSRLRRRQAIEQLKPFRLVCKTWNSYLATRFTLSSVHLGNNVMSYEEGPFEGPISLPRWHESVHHVSILHLPIDADRWFGWHEWIGRMSNLWTLKVHGNRSAVSNCLKSISFDKLCNLHDVEISVAGSDVEYGVLDQALTLTKISIRFDSSERKSEERMYGDSFSTLPLGRIKNLNINDPNSVMHCFEHHVRYSDRTVGSLIRQVDDGVWDWPTFTVLLRLLPNLTALAVELDDIKHTYHTLDPSSLPGLEYLEGSQAMVRSIVGSRPLLALVVPVDDGWTSGDFGDIVDLLPLGIKSISYAMQVRWTVGLRTFKALLRRCPKLTEVEVDFADLMTEGHTDWLTDVFQLLSQSHNPLLSLRFHRFAKPGREDIGVVQEVGTLMAAMPSLGFVQADDNSWRRVGYGLDITRVQEGIGGGRYEWRNGHGRLWSKIFTLAPRSLLYYCEAMPKDKSRSTVDAGSLPHDARRNDVMRNHLPSKLHDLIRKCKDDEQTEQAVIEGLDFLISSQQPQNFVSKISKLFMNRLLTNRCLCWVEAHLNQLYFEPDGGITYIREGFFNPMDFAINIAARALPDKKLLPTSKKECEDAFSLFTHYVKQCEKHFKYAHDLWLLSRDEKDDRKFVCRKARKSLEKIKVYWVEGHDVDIMEGRFVMLDTVVPTDVTVPKSINILDSSDLVKLKPQGDKPQLHVALDKLKFATSNPTHPGLRDPDWTPKSLDELDIEHVVCVAAYNIYKDSDRGLQLCREHAEHIRMAAATRRPVGSRSGMQEKGSLYGISGVKLFQGSQRIAEWKPTIEEETSKAAEDEGTSKAYLYDYSKFPSNQEELRHAHEREAVYQATCGAGSHCHLVMQTLWPSLTLTWKAATCNSSAPRGPGGTASTQYAGVGYIAGLHKDCNDLGFSVAMTFERSPTIDTPDATAMIIPEFKAPTPCVTFWRSDIHYHTTTLDPYYLGRNATGRRPADAAHTWQSIGVVCTLQAKSIIAAQQGRLIDDIDLGVQYPREWALDIIKAYAGKEGWLDARKKYQSISQKHSTLGARNSGTRRVMVYNVEALWDIRLPSLHDDRSKDVGHGRPKPFGREDGSEGVLSCGETNQGSKEFEEGPGDIRLFKRAAMRRISLTRERPLGSESRANRVTTREPMKARDHGRYYGAFGKHSKPCTVGVENARAPYFEESPKESRGPEYTDRADEGTLVRHALAMGTQNKRAVRGWAYLCTVAPMLLAMGTQQPGYRDCAEEDAYLRGKTRRLRCGPSGQNKGGTSVHRKPTPWRRRPSNQNTGIMLRRTHMCTGKPGLGDADPAARIRAVGTSVHRKPTRWRRRPSNQNTGTVWGYICARETHALATETQQPDLPQWPQSVE
ncbi:hypothetical protein JAAARDRAFT_51445 [Jaapia argillacea MUCL 33604]|uniref:Uncharacterized protein n=1 Tax=Jaapia argillacea MUCL 33604 TaxID=933084 RepID=A0A067P5L2_9AGAM|nr:hypothetical protein JAAARDRAFT_51445 [Jaapia argillacea MUCL 33604]